jgi:hypothetical protein
MSRTILAKRIIKMAHRDDMTQEQLRDDALAHLQNNPLFQVTLEPKNAGSAVGSLRFLSPQVDVSQELVATGPPTKVPIRCSNSCFSGPLPAAMRKAPISISATWPPEGRFGSCLTNTRLVSESRASNHRSPLALW